MHINLSDRRTNEEYCYYALFVIVLTVIVGVLMSKAPAIY